MKKLLAIVSMFAAFEVSAAQVSDYAASPPLLAGTQAPLVMLALTHDHSLYTKAYSDYSDLDRDGVIDSTYNNSFSYFGNFASDYCYAYTAGRFVPVSVAAKDHVCSAVGNAPDIGSWSGNFLNWLTTTRMDVLRRVLYGGKRASDPESGEVILERALLPTDTHAFAKVYRGRDMANYTPWAYGGNRKALSFCNVTDGPANTLSRDLDTNQYPPQLKVAEGDWPNWATDEAYQCSYTNTQSPDTSKNLGDFNVLVTACVDGLDATTERCRAYPNGSYKPSGLLQSYGELGRLRFGLLTGSFVKNNEGGVLRKNIDYIVNNSDPDKNEIDTSTGQFINQEVDAATGRIKPGIINTLNRLRISRYKFGAYQYDDCSTAGITNRVFRDNSKAEVQCGDWGNPVGEIMMEALRYFSGRGEAHGAYDGDDGGSDNPTGKNYIANLGKVAWEDFMPDGEECSNCAIILLSSGLNAFDNDNLIRSSDGVTAINSDSDYSRVAADLATVEGINGDYMVGRLQAASNSSHGVCTTKTVTPQNFDEVLGVCPELPDHDGSYSSSILAYHAKRTDLRPDLAGLQNVDTYTVQLAETVSSFDIDINGKKVVFVPQCRSEDKGSDRQCSMLDIRIQQELTSDSGAIHVVWEDSSWGSDNDVDAIQSLEYCVASACSPSVGTNRVQFTVNSVRQSSNDPMTFGFVVTGTTQDSEYSYSTADAAHANGEGASFVLDVDGTGSVSLENPLWYAAKFGSFDDLDGDGTPLYKGDPTDHREWDTRDVEGNIGADGLPDHYFPVRNPAKLESSLALIFAYIANQTSSSTSAAVVASAGTGEGALYQAFYYPRIEQTDADGNVERRVSWVGSVHGLMIDRFGRLREDNPNGNSLAIGDAASSQRYRLDQPSVDPIIEIYYDRALKRTLFSRSNGTEVFERDIPFDQIRPLWSGHRQLAEVSNVVTQRPYGNNAATGRYIFTWIDADKDGAVDGSALGSAVGSEVVAFDQNQFDPTDFARANNVDWLDLNDDSRATDIVNWIRGQDAPGLRSRAVQLDEDDELETWRIGDIVHSTPVVVGPPQADYDRRYSDESYTAFRQQYADRRQVTYVGGNDGLLHAFNAGKRVPGPTLKYDGAGHTLGAELWAYAPGNLLPHLQWLVDTDYPHVYYVDGDPQVFDVKAFTPDPTHPGGWGTILVVGMRLGGGPLEMQHVRGVNPLLPHETRSAWIVMDITDPEQPPRLLAEFSPPGAGFTTVKPALMKRAGAQGQDWYLLFGSGPTELDSGTSLQDSKLFAWSIRNRAEVTVPTALAADVRVANSFVGSVVVEDSDGDYRDDVAYIGLAGGTTEASSGQLKRADLHNDTGVWFGAATSSETMIDPIQPFLTRPVVSTNRFGGARWLAVGTGRLLSGNDAPNSQQQSFYGFKDRSGGAAITRSDLIDVTRVVVYTDGSVTLDNGDPVVIESEVVTRYTRLRTLIDEKGGWFRDFDNRINRGSERTLHDATAFNNFLVFTSFEPGVDSCVVEGQGYIYAIDAFTGLPDPLNTPLGNSDGVANTVLELGPTVPSQPIIHESLEGGSKAIVQGSKGEFLITQLEQAKALQGRQSWREIEWEELLQVPGL